MPEPLFDGIRAETLRELSGALRSGRLAWPPTSTALRARGLEDGLDALRAGITSLESRFPAVDHAVLALEILADERAASEKAQRNRFDLVWSGPESASESRDTAVVAAELFTGAKRKVLASTYNLSDPTILRPLVENKRSNPDLDIKLFVHIDDNLMRSRPQIPGEGAVAVFRRYFDAQCWPSAAMPAVYYDPRILRGSGQGQPYAILHAKCIIADEEAALITSANFSEPAHNQNIEAGILVRDAIFARALTRQFENLVARGDLERVV